MTELLPSPSNDPENVISKTDCDIDNQIKELKHEFHDILADYPEILKYIERLHTIIRRQQKKLNKFYNKLKDHVRSILDMWNGSLMVFWSVRLFSNFRDL